MKKIEWAELALAYCLFTLFCVPSSATGVSGQTADAPKDVRIEISLKPDKQTIMLGEPMFLVFEVKNLTSERLCFGVGGDYRNSLGRPDSFKVSVKASDNSEVPQPEVANFGGFLGCQPIESGESHQINLFLEHWATIERPGSYAVNVKRHMAFHNYQAKPNVFPEPEFVMQADVRTEFTVVPYDENRMGGVINSLGSIMLDVSDPRALESAQALASIRDKRVISYFVEALRRFRNSEFDFGKEDSLSSRAVIVLGTFDDDRAIEALQAAMGSTNEDTRLNVATAFGDSPHHSATKLLLKMQKDSYWFVRLRVAQGLSNVGTVESLAALKKLINDENEHVRKAARKSESN